MFESCEFTALSGRYAIHQSRAASLTVKDCTFSAERGIHINRDGLTDVTITGNTFIGIGDEYGAICFANDSKGDYSVTVFDISGNKAVDQVFLRQLNTTITSAQLSAILDTTKNTYGTDYVANSVIPE